MTIIKITDPRHITIGKNIIIEHDIKQKYSSDQLHKLVEDMLLKESIIANKIEVF